MIEIFSGEFVGNLKSADLKKSEIRIAPEYINWTKQLFICFESVWSWYISERKLIIDSCMKKYILAWLVEVAVSMGLKFITSWFYFRKKLRPHTYIYKSTSQHIASDIPLHLSKLIHKQIIILKT